MDKIKNLMNNFYYNEVILPNDKVTELREKKNINITRLKDGINKYNEDNNTDYKLYENLEQGSIAMSTAIEPEYDDFDIDVAIIFEKEKIPLSTDEMKDLIIDFLKPYNYYFKENPKKKNNCIRIEYQDNYHIDFAVYRVSNDYYEHCGLNWTERNPRSINNWFHEQNNLYDDKLRKITRLIKYFFKTRKDWDICGGFIITILVNEALANITLDVDIDKLLIDVIKSISNRINFNTSVKNPTNNQELINDDKNKKRLKNLKEKLDEHISDIENAYLNNDEEDVKRKWNKFFKTDYFTTDSQQRSRCEDNEMFIENIYSIDKLMPIKFEIKCQRYISKDNFKNSTYVNCFDNQKFSITQNRDEKLCFSIDTTIPKPYILLWKIKNNGNYAIENNSLRGEIYYGNNLNSFPDDPQSFKRFENISFKGNHYVECYLIKDNKCIAKSRFNVNIE